MDHRLLHFTQNYFLVITNNLSELVYVWRSISITLCGCQSKKKKVVDIVNEITHCTVLGAEEHLKWGFIIVFIRLSTVERFDQKCSLLSNALVEICTQDRCQVHLHISSDSSSETAGGEVFFPWAVRLVGLEKRALFQLPKSRFFHSEMRKCTLPMLILKGKRWRDN